MRWLTLLAIFFVNASIGLSQETNNRAMVISHGGSIEKRPAGFPSLHPRTNASTSVNAESTYQLAPSLDPPSVPNQSAAIDGLSLDSQPESSRSKMTGPLVTVCSSLAIVLALFSALVWVGRRFGGGVAASKPLPASALTPMGHVMLDPRTKLLLVKCGRRILVLSQTASGITPITEVTHPDEVRELVASCSAEARAVFEKTLREIELEPARGFTGPSDEPMPRPATAGANTARANGRLFATA